MISRRQDYRKYNIKIIFKIKDENKVAHALLFSPWLAFLIDLSIRKCALAISEMLYQIQK